MSDSRLTMDYVDWSNIDSHIYESVDTSLQYLVIIEWNSGSSTYVFNGEFLNDFMMRLKFDDYECVRVYKLVEIYEKIE